MSKVRFLPYPPITYWPVIDADNADHVVALCPDMRIAQEISLLMNREESAARKPKRRTNKATAKR